MFKVECPGCRAPYQVDERRVPSSGLKMRCPKCTTSFKVDPPSGGAEGGAVLGAVLGASVPKAAGAPQRRPGATMLGVAPAQVSSPPANPSAPSDLPALAGGSEASDLPVRADVDRTAPLAGGPPAAAKAPPPVPPRRPRPPPAHVAATAVTEPSLSLDLDLPAPSIARRAEESLPRPVERPAPPRAPERAPQPAPSASFDLDLPSIATLPPAAELPDVRAGRAPETRSGRPPDVRAGRASHQEIELDLPSPSADLPARGSARPGGSLPAPGLDLPLPAATQVGLPVAHAGLPSPAAGLPSPAAGLPLASAGLPSASAGLPSSHATPGQSLPVPSAGLPMQRPSLPAAFGSLPSPGTQSESSGFSLTPPAAIGELDLPPMPPETPGLGARFSFDEPARDVDPFGEAELPPPRSLRDDASNASQPPAPGSVIRQEGGGTSYGEVNLGGDSSDLAIEAPQPPPTSARGQAEDMEFEAVPQEKGHASVPDARRMPEPAMASAPERSARPSRRGGMKAFVGVCLALAAGGALALLPEVGPFGAHWIVDRMRSSEYDALIQSTIGSARKRFGADTAPEANRAWNEADQARGQAKRLKPLTAYAAFVGYLRELRFGAAPEIHARANVLLDEFEQQADVPYLLLARAARAATEGQLARARQSLGAVLAGQRGNVDALVLSGEVELRAKNTKAALEAWQAVSKLEDSARAVFGLARAEFGSGDVAKAEAHAKAALEKNPHHVGAKILLARIASSERKTEAGAVQTLESITEQGALASSEELVNAFTLLGDIHLARSRISKAEAAYTSALKLEPKAPGALRGLGESLFRAGRYSEAQARFEAGAQADPDDLDAKVGVAKSKFMLERVEEANESLNKLFESHPSSVLAAYWRGRVLESRGERDLAEKSYRKAIEQKADSDPMLVEAYIALALLENQQGKADAALATLNAARERFPSTPAIHRALGDVALTQGRYAEAKTEFERALELDAEDLGARFRLGIALRRDSKFDASAAAFDAVGAIDSEFPGLALERGLLYEASGKTELALKQYEGARAKAPDDPDLMLRVGCGYASAGRTKEAEELLRKVLALRPTSAETQHCLGRALLAEGSRLADALRLLERAAELDPHRAEYHLYVGWAANEAGNVVKAQRALDEAIKLDHGLGDAYWQRGVLRSRQGAVKDAIADLTRALTLKPSRHEAHAALADAYYDLGKEPLALGEWQKAVEAQPDNATWRFRYGKLLAANHRNEPARGELSRALELAEQNPRGERWLWEAHHLLARVLGNKPEAAPHWEAFLRLGPLDSPYRSEAKSFLERLGRPWTGN